MIEETQPSAEMRAIIEKGWRISPIATASWITQGIELQSDGWELPNGDKAPRGSFIAAPHLKMLSDAIVEAVTDPTGGRLIVTMPPRYGKSHLVSTFTPLWFLENWPKKHVINCGYGQEFASEWGALVRNIIMENKRQFSFTLRQDTQAAHKWKTNRGGGMLTAGIGGPITGRGANLLLIDDPIKNAKEAASFQFREDLWRWYVSAAYTRLAKNATIIVVQTRWTEDDLVGKLTKHAGKKTWRVINFPAVWDEKCVKELGTCPLGRKLGDVLWPEMFNKESLEENRLLDELTWESLYQQRPGSVAGIGNVYSGFTQRFNCSRTIVRDPALPLVWTLDFNRNPFCSVFAQYKEWWGDRPWLSSTGQPDSVVEVIDELCLKEANTLEMCGAALDRILNMTGGRPTVLELYGDPAAAAKHTSQTSGSDYDIIRNFFRNQRGIDFRFKVATKTPHVKDRTNAVNGLLHNARGETRLFIDPRCKMLIRDLESVRWKRDIAGNDIGQIDKVQADLTHISDALGYFIHGKFKLQSGTSGEHVGIMR